MTEKTSTVLAWETCRESYRRRVSTLCQSSGYQWHGGQLNTLLERLTLVVGDPVTGPDLQVVVRLYNRELIGARRRHKELEK